MPSYLPDYYTRSSIKPPRRHLFDGATIGEMQRLIADATKADKRLRRSRQCRSNRRRAILRTMTREDLACLEHRSHAEQRRAEVEEIARDLPDVEILSQSVVDVSRSENPLEAEDLLTYDAIEGFHVETLDATEVAADYDAISERPASATRFLVAFATSVNLSAPKKEILPWRPRS